MSLSRKSFIIGRLPGCKLGPIGLGKTSPPVRTSGFSRILSLRLLIWFANPKTSLNGSGILVQPALVDVHFRQARMPYFRREWHPVVSPQAFLDFVGDHLLSEASLDLPILTGEELHGAAMAKTSTAGGIEGWAWNEVEALSLSWFVGLA